MSTLDTILVIASIVVLSAAIGTSVLLIVDARRDLVAIRTAAIGNGRSIVARSSLLTEGLRLGSLVALSVYVIAVALVDAPTIARAAFVAAILALLGQSLSVYSMRRRLFDAYRHDRPGTHPPRFTPTEEPSDAL